MGKTVLISGGTATGKTTLLSVLAHRTVREALRIADYDRTTQRFDTGVVYDSGTGAHGNSGQYAFPFFEAFNWKATESPVMEASHAVF